ncbi:MAG: hypothetical protein ABFD69_04120 [Candidatus Sumerlaeia bacterium]
MGLFSKLFGSKPAVEETPDDMITFHDGYGRPIGIRRDVWRDQILPKDIKDHWNDPDQLAGAISISIQHNIFKEVLGAAQRLARIDTSPERGAVLLAIVYANLKKLKEAERALTDYIRVHGESSEVLAKLAKFSAQAGNAAQRDDYLWRSIQLNPNNHESFVFYFLLEKEKGGEEAATEACRKIAALPGSWLAQLSLARHVLDQDDPGGAMLLYQESLANAPDPVPADLLIEMSGDLGQHGKIEELIKLVAPRFDAELHGLSVGHNLITAYNELNNPEAARVILSRLEALNRPDWAEAISKLAESISKVRIATATLPAKPRYGIMAFEGPIWLGRTSPANQLFPAHADTDPTVVFIGSTADTGADEKNHQPIELRSADAAGSLCRSFPLFLSEMMHLLTGAKAQTLIPWVGPDPCGFVLSTKSYGPEMIDNVRQWMPRSDYLVITHVIANGDSWKLCMRLIRMPDSSTINGWEVAFPPQSPVKAATHMATQLQGALKQLGIAARVPPAHYKLPQGERLTHYLTALHALLTVRCGSQDGVPATFVNTPLDALGHALDLCLLEPENPTVRILLAQMLIGLNKKRPEVASGFKPRVELLQREHPLEVQAHAAVDQMLAQV